MPLKLVQRPRSPYWIMRGTVRGQSLEESTGTADRRAAEEIRIKREGELLAQSIHGRRATATFAEAALSYLKAGGAHRFLEPVVKHFSKIPLAKIDQDAIDEGALKVYPNVANATRDRQFYTPVSAVLKHAARRKWCDWIEIQRPDVDDSHVRWIAPAQAEQLIAACSPHLRPLVIFLLYTGARAGEAVWLPWSALDLANAHVSFIDTKNGESRGVPLHARVVATLANLAHRDGNVFRKPNGMPYAPLREFTRKGTRTWDLSASDRIRKAFGGACTRAGVADFTPHDCRHTWATWHYAANRDLGALMRLGGWKTVAMVLRYAHVNVGELAHTIDKLPTETPAATRGQSGDSTNEETKSA